MKEIAETYLGESVNEAIITVPAYFDDAQRQATKDAGKIAGLDVKRIINEPTAAALAYGLESGEDRCVAVYDLGGGTFDISVLDIVDGVFSVKATGGDTHLGGEDFDTRVIKLLAEEFEAKYSVNLLSDSSSLQRLREAAERAKHELSSSLETEVNIPFIATNASGPLHLERSLKRSELDILCRDLVTRTLEACKMTIAAGNVELSEIDEVVLVGGMTRMPAVQSAVAEFFAKAPAKSVNPDEVVALGAALQGAALSGAIEEVLLLDVTPLSIGVETGGGVFTRLIPRNTTIPTERSEVFTTSVDNQTFVPIHVLQGEREMAQDNRSLAHFELTGIPPAPRGLPKIQVAFSIDAEGLLSVEAADLGTSRSQNISVKASSGLSQEEVDKLVQQGELFHQADILRRDLAELKNKAETLVYQTEQAVEAYADFVPPELIAVVQEDTNHLRGLMAGGSDLESLRGAHAQLENSAFELAEALYGDDAETPTIDESPENQTAETDEQTLENS